MTDAATAKLDRLGDIDAIIWHEVPLVLLRLDGAGTVVDCNLYARQLSGRDLTGIALNQLVLSFGPTPVLQDVHALTGSDVPVRLHLATGAGLPCCLLFRFVQTAAHEVLAIGWHDMPELLGLQQQLINLNNELSNTSRAAMKDSRFQIDRQTQDQRRILEAAGEGILGLNAQGLFSLVNPAAAALLGYAVDELIGQPGSVIWRNLAKDRAESVAPISPIRQTLDAGVFHTDQSANFWRQDGSVFPVTFTARPITEHRRVLGAVVTFVDVSERLRIEQALQASERRYRQLFLESPQPMWLFDDATLRFLDVNHSAIRHYGYSADEFRQMTLKDIHQAADVPHLQQALATSPSRVAAGEFRHQRKNGEVIDVLVWTAPTEEDGQPRRIVVVNDITQRKRAEMALQESEQHFRTLANTGSMLIWTAGLDKLCNYFNEPWLRFTGRTLQQEIGNGWTEGVHPDDFERCLDTYVRAFEQQQTFSMDYRLRHADGSFRWIRDDGNPRYNSSGDFLGYIGYCMDITERKLNEEQLRIGATTFQSQQGTVVTDAHEVIIRANRAFTETTGYSTEEVAGKTPRVLSSGRHDAAFYAAMWDSIKRTGFWQGEIWNRRKNGEIYPEWLWITAVSGPDGAVTHYVGNFIDITERKLAAEKIEHMAFYDALTDLPNRRLMLDRLGQALASSARNKKNGALLMIDLDNFKSLNDTLGHDVGDQLLVQVAARLRACIREGDTVARLGGDEFVVVLGNLGESTLDAATQAEMVGQKILAALNLPYQLGHHSHHSTPSIGITLFADSQGTADDVMKLADLAMYQAKAAGRNTLRFFNQELQAVVLAQSALEADMREALANGGFELYYQAQMSHDGQVSGAEALVRWHHPQRGMVAPTDFIGLAEDTGLILPLGRWVLNEACRQLACWATQPDMQALSVAVNVSAHQFKQPDFVQDVLQVLAHNGSNPKRLKLELTESLLIADVEDTIAKMQALKSCGIRFSLDDFGTGYSSLSYLKRLPLEQLKIDQSFVRDVLTDPNDAAIALTILALGRSLGLSVIAEGVETTGQRDFLAGNGCHAYQGYLFSRPLPVAAYEQFVRQILCSAGDQANGPASLGLAGR